MELKNYIKTKFYTISPQATFKQALETMIANKTNGLIVMDNQGKPVGTIDSFNLINNITPEYLQDDPSLAKFETDEVVYKAIEQVWDRSVEDMMQTLNGVCVHDDDPFILAAALASKHGIRYIPVMDKDEHHITGIITRTEIKRGIAKIMHIEETP